MSTNVLFCSCFYLRVWKGGFGIPVLQMRKGGLRGINRKGRGTRDQIAKIRWIMEKAREFQKNIDFCFIDYLHVKTVVNDQKIK